MGFFSWFYEEKASQMTVLKIISQKSSIHPKIFRYAIRKWNRCWRHSSLNNIELSNKRPVILPANGNGLFANG
jgi:hypothetical protein